MKYIQIRTKLLLNSPKDHHTSADVVGRHWGSPRLDSTGDRNA